MLLAINLNNTNVKFSLFEGDDVVAEWRQQTSARIVGAPADLDRGATRP